MLTDFQNFCAVGKRVKFATKTIQNSEYFPILIANKIFHVIVFYLFTFAINFWHRKFVTEDVTAVFVNSQHDIQCREQDFDKS